MQHGRLLAEVTFGPNGKRPMARAPDRASIQDRSIRAAHQDALSMPKVEKRGMMNQDEAERSRQELIEDRAYGIYQARGGQDGFHEDDWLQAEREIDGVPLEDDRLPGSEGEEVSPGGEAL